MLLDRTCHRLLAAHHRSGNLSFNNRILLECWRSETLSPFNPKVASIRLTPERKVNYVLFSFFDIRGVVGQFELWQRCYPI